MSLLTDIKSKFTMLQDDFGPEDDGPAEAANSDAPEEKEPEVVVVDEKDEGTEEKKPYPKEPSAPAGDCEVSWFRLEGPDMCEAFKYWRYVLQGSNVWAFFVTVTVNFTSQYFMKYSLSEVTKDWSLPVDPSGYAFSIWGVIYGFMGLFVAYQAVPGEWIKYLGGRRNDDMLFNQMNFIFVLNMFFNAAWLPTFQSNTQWGFIIGEILLIGIWITNTALMVIADHNEMWWLEIIMVRVPFSIYSGWVTSATILNTSYMLKSWGMTDDLDRVRPLTGTEWTAWNWANFAMFNGVMTEEYWTIVAGWMALVFYNLIAWEERNPIFGMVFAWAGLAILLNNI